MRLRRRMIIVKGWIEEIGRSSRIKYLGCRKEIRFLWRLKLLRFSSDCTLRIDLRF